MKLFSPPRPNARGFTLVELMITVAIVGILASIAGVAYTKYIASAKVTKLKQYAMEISNAQEQYKSQNSGYLNPSNNTYSESDAEWTQLLGFSHKGLDAQDITIQTEAGGAGGNCSICGDHDPDNSGIWFAVVVEQDMKKKSSDQTTVIFDNHLPSPLVLNEGE